MNIEKSKSIRDGLQRSFRNGTSKLARRKCYGYDIGPDGELVVNPDEATVVRWILAVTSVVTVWARLLLGWRNRAFPLPRVGPSGIGKRSTN